MSETLHEVRGDYYMDVRTFPGGGMEVVVKAIRPMHQGAVYDSANPDSYVNYCKEHGLPTGREVHKRWNAQEASENEKEQNHARSVRRSKKTIRHLVCSMQADRLFTLTYRDNVTDRERVKSDFKRFLRLVRKGWAGQGGLPDWQYVATLERQDRGAYHIHCAVRGWQKISFLRAAWYKALGGTGREEGEATPGQVDVTSARKARWGNKAREWRTSKLAAYITKYIGKTFVEIEDGIRRYWHSKDLTVPAKERYILNAYSLVQAIECARDLLYLAYGRGIDFTRSWLSHLKDTLWIGLEPGPEMQVRYA